MTAQSSPPPRIAVVGSLNIDLVMRVERFADPGETLAATDFQTFIGGKGFNQAIAAARQGALVSMVGRVGDDEFGLTLRSVAVREGMQTEYLLTTPGVASGVANIVVDSHAENLIYIAAGANGRLIPADTEAARAVLQGVDLVLAQLEVPLETVSTALRLARQAGVMTMLVPAPARPLPADLLANVDVLVANRSEISLILSEATHDPELDARRALKQGPSLVVVTLGSRGALAVRRDEPTLTIPAFPVEAVDTTGAGDAFAGGLAVGLAAKEDTEAALRRGAACGALACTVMGAEPSLPRRESVDRLLGKGNC